MRSIRALFARLFKRGELVVVDCEDVTSDYVVESGERVFSVKYYKRGVLYTRRIRYTGVYSEVPEIAELQRYCVERIMRKSEVEKEEGEKRGLG